MNVQDIKNFIKVKEELSNLSFDIFYYVKEKYVDQLEFGRYSSYSKYYFINEKELCIEYYEYGYDCYNENWLPKIPIEFLEEETSWKKFLDDYYEKKKKEKEEKKAKEEQDKEDRERELYKKLKQKFENNYETI